jgi:hypothetical protein
MHIAPCAVSSETLLQAEPLKYGASQKTITKICLALGIVGLVGLLSTGNSYNFWGSFYVNLFFWTGLAAGSCIIPAIFSIVGAKWAPPIRRMAEANSAFLPIAYVLFLISFFGKEHLFPWAIGDMPGRETWMQPLFVYSRFAFLLALLFWMMRRFVRISLRQDIGLLREKAAQTGYWSGKEFDSLVSDWKGSEVELPATRARLAWNGPLLILVYAVVYSLFAFEMLMSMDTVFYSNLFGAFIFVGNIFMGWAMLCLNSTRVAFTSPLFKKVLGVQQLWDIGKLNFGFTMLWGYMFFSQFLPYWYANIPETSQWMILRTREFPWMGLGYVVFSCCFIFPFILLLSDDIKKNPYTYRIVACVILVGMWLEKYVLIMPQLFPQEIPLGFFDLAMFLGFFGLYRWKVHGFLEKYPYVAVANMHLDEQEAEHH